MTKTPDQFYNQYIGKAIDVDGGYGVQCVDGFRAFCNWAIGYSWPTGNGWADGYWYNRAQHKDQFDEVDKNHLKNGDWVFWAKGSKSHPSSHVAMYYNGKSFGQNQNDAKYGRGFSLHPTDFSDILGGLRWKGFESKPAAPAPKPAFVPIKAVPYAVFRLYNAKNGDHFYTANVDEANSIKKAGWKDEGIAWYHDDKGNPVYRVYNPNSGEHFYTASKKEYDALAVSGWKQEGVAFGSGKGKPVYRLYNTGPNGKHFFTTSDKEKDALLKSGWKDEGIAFKTK